MATQDVLTKKVCKSIEVNRAVYFGRGGFVVPPSQRLLGGVYGVKN